MMRNEQNEVLNLKNSGIGMYNDQMVQLELLVTFRNVLLSFLGAYLIPMYKRERAS